MPEEADQETIEQKKERMREYIAADRKLDKEKERRQRRRRGGCIGRLLKLALFVAALAGIGYLIWLWHPWSTEIVTVDAVDQPGICSPGVEGKKTTEYFTLFGIRLYESGGATMCLE